MSIWGRLPGLDWVRFEGCQIDVRQGFVGNPTRISGSVVSLRGAHCGESAEVSFPVLKENRLFASTWSLLMEGEYEWSGLNELVAKLANETVFEVRLREDGATGGIWNWLSLSELIGIAPAEAQAL